MQQNYEYFAFISYNGTDEKWAKWLQHSLEYYHIPSTLCEEYPNLPKKIRPVFWYKQDLSGTKLKQSLWKELESSKHLIVICSPDAAKSDWVNDEIKSFILQDKGDKIIPFIVGGTPHSVDIDDECFPEALRDLSRDEEIRGIDVNEQGKSHALLDTIATMFGVRKDVLLQRHERRRKRIRNVWIAVCSLLILFGIGVYNYTRTKVEFYADYVDCWGIPEGIYELDKDTRTHKQLFYRFKYKRIPIGEKNSLSWRLAEVSTVNSAGTIIENPAREFTTRYSIYRYFYSPTTGSLREIHLCDALGKTLFRQKVATYNSTRASIYDLIGSSDEDASGYLNAYTIFSPTDKMMMPIQKTGIKRIVYQRDKNGYIIGVTFHSNNSDNFTESVVADANGAYGHSYKVDSIGRMTELRLLNENGNAINGVNGVSIIKLGYSDYNIISKTSLDSFENLISDENLICQTQYQYDVFGNIIKELYYGLDKQRVYTKEMISGKSAEYDSYGNCTKITMLNASDIPTTDIYGINQILYDYDSKGRQKEISYRDISGFLHMCKEGYALIRLKYYKNTVCPIYAEFYGTDFNPIKNNYGIAAYERDLDDRGNVKWENYYNENWKRSKNSNLVSRIESDYDENCNLIRQRFYDENDQPCVNNNSVHGFEIHYDNRGNISKHTWIGVKGNVVEDKLGGVSSITYKYDNHGNLIERRFWDKNNDKALHRAWGIHKQVFYYDKFGIANVIEIYGINDSLCCNTDGVAIVSMTLDNQGNIIKTEYLNENKKLCNNKYGISTIDTKYNSHRLQTECVFYNVDGNFTEDENGVARYISVYNNQGKQTLFSMFNKDDKLQKGKDGYAKIEMSYDDHGLPIETAYIGIDGKLSSENRFGYAKLVNEYDSCGNLIRCATYDSINNLCVNPATGYAKFIGTYDSRGRIVKREVFNDLNNPVVCNYGYATWVAEYDEEGYLIESSNLDTLGHIIMKESNSNLNNLPNDTSDYNKYYFRYSLSDVIIGGITLFISLMLMTMCINKIRHKNKEYLLALSMSCIICIGLAYVLCKNYLLHVGILTPYIYNYTWVFLILPLGCSVGSLIWFIIKPARYHYMKIRKEWRLSKLTYQKKWYKRLYHSDDVWIIIVVIVYLVLIGYLLSEAFIEIIQNPL